MNPEAFYFDDRSPPKLSQKGPRNVLVIGGGVAGMEAAIVAADRGHNVTLMEKAAVLGGIINIADRDAYKGDLDAFKDLLVRRVKRRNIKVILATEATPDDVRSSGADAVILAIGSKSGRASDSRNRACHEGPGRVRRPRQGWTKGRHGGRRPRGLRGRDSTSRRMEGM